MLATIGRPGIVVLDSELSPVASNADAIQILTFPEVPERISDLDMWLANRVRSRLLNGRSPGERRFVSHFKSAKRTYVCRTFPIHFRPNAPASGVPATLLMLERNTNGTTTMDEIAERFGLTRRELDTVKLLLQGLTSKEIADRMAISPNTVKAFIRLVMVKMKVSTRSGIVGKIAEAQTVAFSAAMR